MNIKRVKMEIVIRNWSDEMVKCHEKYGFKLGADIDKAVAVIKKVGGWILLSLSFRMINLLQASF